MSLLAMMAGKSLGGFTNQTVCPPWMADEDGLCQCNPSYSSLFQGSFLRSVFCDRLSLTTYAASGTCFTHSNSSLIDADYVIGDCPYVPVRNQSYFHRLLKALPENESDLDHVMCGPFNREGLLCSRCRPGYGIAVYSIGYPCAECGSSSGLFVFLYLLLELAPITVFYVIVVVFRVRATTPPLAGLVFFSHAILNTVRFRIFIYTILTFSTPKHISVAWQLLTFFCSIWSLEFFRVWVPPFCISQHLTNVHAVLLEYLSAFYPLVLVFVSFVTIELHSRNVRFLVWLWSPFNRVLARFRRSWDIHYSIINAFSTFLLLSYSKILTVSFRLLYQTSIYDLNRTRIARSLHIDPNIENFGSSGQSLISIAAISIIGVFSVLPLLLLLLYPTRIFQKVLRQCTCRAKHALHIFVETYQGCLKDGSDGTRDYRAVSALYLVLRISLLGIYIRDTELVQSGLSFVIYCLVFFAFAIFIFKFQPYKEGISNSIEFITFIMLGNIALFMYIWIIFPENGYAMFLVTIALIPHCIVACYFLYSTFVRHKAKLALGWIRNHIRVPDISGHTRNSAWNWLLRSFRLSSTNYETELPDRFVNPENYIRDDDASSNNRALPSYQSVDNILNNDNSYDSK